MESAPKKSTENRWRMNEGEQAILITQQHTCAFCGAAPAQPIIMAVCSNHHHQSQPTSSNIIKHHQ